MRAAFLVFESVAGPCSSQFARRDGPAAQSAALGRVLTARLLRASAPRRGRFCRDCGEPGELTGHMGCQYPQDRP
jgi:hypothetical protein